VLLASRLKLVGASATHAETDFTHLVLGISYKHINASPWTKCT